MGAFLYFLSIVFPPFGIGMWMFYRDKKPALAIDHVFAAGVGGGLYSIILLIQLFL
jgi:hypothetical protein